MRLRYLSALFSILALAISPLYALINLENLAQDFVLETKKIEIPGYPKAFNPSIIRWKGVLLMTFRHMPNVKPFFTSYVGIVKLDENFDPIGPPQTLETQNPHSPIPSRAEDTRLIAIGDTLFLVFSDNKEEKITKKGFRVYIAQLTEDNGRFSVHNIECLSHFEGESPMIREKNWTPFDYNSNLLLSYSIAPHIIFRPFLGTGHCETFCSSNPEIRWKWGELRGGTTATVEGREYLGFFHSVKMMASENSQEKIVPHYFMGAYTYSLEPPFSLQRISPEPIIGKGFYSGGVQTPYWGSKKVIFPCGYIADEKCFWISYGRQDEECWVVKIDKNAILNSLIPVY